MQYLRRLLLTAVAVTVALTAPAAAQKVDNSYREFPAYGFKFKSMRDWLDVPVKPEDMERRSMIAQFSQERGDYVEMGNDRREYRSTLVVLKIDPKEVVTSAEEEEEEGGGLRGRVEREEAKEKTGRDYVLMAYGGAVRQAEFAEVVPEVEEVKIEKDYYAKRELFETFVLMSSGAALDAFFDVWTFQVGVTKYVFIWTYPSEKKLARKFNRAVEKSMKSFEFEEVVEAEVKWIDEESTYEDIVKFHQNDVAQTPGWQVVETPSKRYLIKTNSDKDRRIDDVIERLEASRELFEEDFPPEKKMKHVSVVRVVATADEFHKYGGTGAGVGGWFNPRTTELVLFFDPAQTYDETLSVMTHEGFHQYCHFMFHEAKAHRWFDEGHGDYYGAYESKGSRLEPNEDMPGGYSRVPIIKRLVREGNWVPLEKHLNFSHPEWQAKGTDSYSQSFSIIYMLREGAKGRVRSRYWEDEYAEILPNYMKHLAEGYKTALQEAREEKQELLDRLKESGDVDMDKFRALEQWLASVQVDPRKVQEIRQKAMDESWGKIDLDKFQEHWLEFVDNEM